MKKVFVFILMLLIVVSVYEKSNDSVKIPDSAIRFRILANSNSPRDQKIKEDIRDNFIEFNEYRHKCKYADCMHDLEDDCYIKELVKSKTIMKSRYDNYINFIRKVR